MQVFAQRRCDEAERLGIEPVQPDDERTQANDPDLKARQRTLIDIATEIDPVRQVSLPVCFLVASPVGSPPAAGCLQICCMIKIFRLATKCSFIHEES